MAIMEASGLQPGVHLPVRPDWLARHTEAALEPALPYMDVVIAAFGPARCMFESNFPVDKGMCSYQVMWNAFKRIAAGASAAEKAALFRTTAARFYRLEGLD